MEDTGLPPAGDRKRFRNLPNETRPLGPERSQQSLEPLLFFFDLDLIEDRSKTCDEIRKITMENSGFWCNQPQSPSDMGGGTYVVEGGRVRAGRGHFHLERGDERVVGGASSSVGLPPVLTQAPSQ